MATVTLVSSITLRVCPAVVESRFEVEHGGTVYRVICDTPKGTITMTAYEVMTGTIPQ